MSQPPITSRYWLWARPVLGLCLLIGLYIVTGGMSNPVYAKTTLVVSNCSSDAQLQADVTQANNDNNSDVITFSCSGDITLSSTLQITGSMTIDGTGQSVTLDGHNTVGGIFSISPNLTINNLTIANGVSTAGGAILNGGTLTVNNSTFIDNSAPFGGNGGGAIWTNEGIANINSSTFVGNWSSTSGNVLQAISGSILTISNSTIVDNLDSSSDASALANFGSTINVFGSIIANNAGSNCSGSTITDQGYNLESGTDCRFTASTDLQNTNPQVAPLANNGGPTETLALLNNSPAINAIPTSACTATTDQRGITRPQGPACDIGAFELRAPQLSLPNTITVNATSQQGATVTYTATASNPDASSTAATVTCTPSSGSIFPIGTTQVNCSASNAAGQTTGSFQVVVNANAAQQIGNLTTTVNGFHFTKTIQATLDAELLVAQKAASLNKVKDSCIALDVFIGEVQLLTGHGITSSQASQLLTLARQIKALLAC